MFHPQGPSGPHRSAYSAVERLLQSRDVATDVTRIPIRVGDSAEIVCRCLHLNKFGKRSGCTTSRLVTGVFAEVILVEDSRDFWSDPRIGDVAAYRTAGIAILITLACKRGPSLVLETENAINVMFLSPGLGCALLHCVSCYHSLS